MSEILKDSEFFSRGQSKNIFLFIGGMDHVTILAFRLDVNMIIYSNTYVHVSMYGANKWIYTYVNQNEKERIKL